MRRRRRYIDVRIRTAAGPAVLYGLLRNGASWPNWSPIGSFTLERPGEGEREGPSAVRVFRTGRITSREEVVALEPGLHFGYTLLSGLPVRDYRADVHLDTAAAGTTIRWQSSFTARVPGTGILLRGVLARFIRRCAEGLAAHAEKETEERGGQAG